MDSLTTNYTNTPPSPPSSIPCLQFPFVRLLLQLKLCQRTSNSISVRSLRRSRARAQPLEPWTKATCNCRCRWLYLIEVNYTAGELRSRPADNLQTPVRLQTHHAA